MPTPEPTLSERLDIWQCEQDHDADSEGWALVKEAVLRLAVVEAAKQQPEVAELLAKADLRGMQGYPEWAADLRSHIATLVRLAEGEATVARVREECLTRAVEWRRPTLWPEGYDARRRECAGSLERIFGVGAADETAALGGKPDTTDGEGR